MAKLRINKLDAARRQIDAGIRMTFANEDAVAIHSVVSAGHRIIKDLCEQRGDIESYLMFTDWIAPGCENRFWRQMNSSANFFKHADEDAEQVHEMDTDASDYMLLFAIKWYRDLGNSVSNEMKVFAAWFQLRHPDLLKPEALARMVNDGEFYPASSAIRAMSRAESLSLVQPALNRTVAARRGL
jgi:hypothetical protein